MYSSNKIFSSLHREKTDDFKVFHTILPRKGNKAVVFRRGPSSCVAVIGWDLGKDTFMVGQWLRGRIYPFRCDLSPDGKYLKRSLFKSIVPSEFLLPPAGQTGLYKQKDLISQNTRNEVKRATALIQI